MFWTWDTRYGLTPDGKEEVQPLGSDLTGNPLGSTILPDLSSLEGYLADALDEPGYRVSLGVSQAVVEQSRLVFPFRLELGITDWLTVGGMVPLVRPRVEMTFALDADSLTANEGTSPYLSDPAVVKTFLDGLQAAVEEALATHPEEAVVADAQAYLDALVFAYGHGTFFPVVGSASGVKLQERLDAFRQALSDLGVSGIPVQVPLAEGYLDTAAFQEFLGSRYMRAFPLEDWTTPWAIGDAEITVNARLLRRGFQPDSAGTLPSVRVQLGGGVLVRLGTGGQRDPARFFDQDTGDGQLDLEGNVFGLVELGSRIGAWGRVRYGIQTEGETYRRIAAPWNTLPNYSRTAPVRWTPGNYFELDLNPRIFLAPALSFGVRYHLWSKGEDSYSLGNVNPDLQDPSKLPPAELLNQETEQHLQELGFSATYSSLVPNGDRDPGRPLFVRLTYFHPMSGSGGRMPKGGRFEVGLTLFKSLWGGVGKEPGPAQEPVGG